MNTALLAESSILLVLAGVSIAEGIRLIQRFQMSSTDPLGPGGYLIIIATLLAVLTLADLLARSRSGRSDGGLSLSKVTQAAGPFGLLILYVILVPVIGYIPSSVLFFTACFHVFGVKKWLQSAVLGVVTAVVFVGLFIYLAAIPMP